MEAKKIILIISTVAITAFIGGFLLSLFSAEKETQKEKSSEVIDYTGMAENVLNNIGQQLNKEEKEGEVSENDTEEVNEEEIMKEVKNLEKELEKEVDHEHMSHKHIENETLYDRYKGKYDEKTIKQAILQTHEVLYMLTEHSVLSKNIRKDWEKVATNSFIEKIDKKEIDDFSFQGYAETDVVPVESDYEGIAVGLFVNKKGGMALFELDFKPDKNKVLLDDMKIIWER